MIGRSLLPALAGLGLAACPAPSLPKPPPIKPQTIEIGRDGAGLHGVAGDGTLAFAALGARAVTTVEARRATEVVWSAQIAGDAGPLASTGALVVAAVGGAGKVAGVDLRGEPGAVLVALDGANGSVKWHAAIDSTEWSLVTSLAATPDGVLAAGSFAGTLRIGAKVVSSAGKTDGFVARLSAAGDVSWLVRIGGPGADAIQGVAFRGDRIAIAGTFAAGADVLGQPLEPFDDRSFASDVFVAELDPAGARRWAQSFGGKLDDTVAGVAIDERGWVAVAATIRDTVHVGGADLVAQGASDGLVAWWNPDGGTGPAVLVGGSDFDGLRAIAAAADRIVIGGFYSGTIKLGDRALSAAGGDDAFLAALDPNGHVSESWTVSGEGREEITAISALPGGFIAGVAHTSGAKIDADALPAPKDPMAGAALAIRSVP